MELSVLRLRQLAEREGHTIPDVVKRKGGWRSVKLVDAKGNVVPASDRDWHTLLKAWNLLEALPDRAPAAPRKRQSSKASARAP